MEISDAYERMFLSVAWAWQYVISVSAVIIVYIPLYRKLPKRGFTNHFAKKYAIVNVSDLNRFDNGAVVDAEALLAAKIIREVLDGVKILGNGEITKKVTVKAAVFSATAKEKIEAAGGTTEVA